MEEYIINDIKKGKSFNDFQNLELKGNDVGFTPDMVGSEISIEDMYFHGNDVENTIDFAPDYFLTSKPRFGLPKGDKSVAFPKIAGGNLNQTNDRPFFLRGPIGQFITYNINGVSIGSEKSSTHTKIQRLLKSP